MLPTCSSKNSIEDAGLRARHKAGELIALNVTMLREQGVCYVTAYFSDEPARPIYLATRRNRKVPKTFVDMTSLSKSLFADLYASGNPILR